MKTANIIIKIVAALAAVAGVVFVIATYGDKIVAWAKKMLNCSCCCDEECCCEEGECCCEEGEECCCACQCEEPAAEEPAAEEAPAEEAATEADFVEAE